MFTIDLSSKRSRLALRFFTYGVMTLATILLTILAVFYAMGYRFDQNGFEQGGLLQFRSVPQGAQVVVNGDTQSFTTPGRSNLRAGDHTVQMRLNGYRSWQKTVSLAPGQLLWLNYARLLPESITTSKFADFENVAAAMASPDRKWMIVLVQADQPVFTLVDFSDPKKPVVTDLTIPTDQLTKKDDKFGRFVIKEWDLNSRYVLVSHTNGDTHEMLRLDRQHAAEAVNVSRLFSLSIADAHFAGGNANIVYAKTDTVLRSLDIGASSASAALIAGIEQFVVYGNDTIAFVATRDGAAAGTRQKVAGIYIQGKETIARTFAPEETVAIDYTEYTRHAYLAVSTGSGTVTILRDPTATTKDNAEIAQLKVPEKVGWMKFSSSGRMLVAGNGNDVVNYDLELDKLSAWKVSGAALTRPLQWLDDYYLWTDAGGTLRMFEFDNTNDNQVIAVAEGYAASLSSDGSYLYTFKKASSGAFELQGSQLILP